MINYNGVLYLGFEEEWKYIKFEDVKENKYMVSSIGRFKKVKNNKILYGNNSKNEKGYKRIALKNRDGRIKKYAMHRIVFETFVRKIQDGEEINHIDGNKLNNEVNNLEACDRKYNAEHAEIHDLYKSCEDHYRSTFTNDEVENICKLLSEGMAVSDIIHTLNLENQKYAYSNIDKIINRKSWVRISSKYKFDYNTYHYKTYKYEDIKRMCKYVFETDLTNGEICKKFPQYNEKKLKTMLKTLKHGRVYKKVINDYKVQRLSKSIKLGERPS